MRGVHWGLLAWGLLSLSTGETSSAADAGTCEDSDL